MIERPRKDQFEMGTMGRYRNFAIKAARDLLYGPEVEKKIREAKTMEEISRIMTTARLSMK